MLRLRSNTSNNNCAEQSIETRPKMPESPFSRFIAKRRNEMWSEIHKEASRRWAEMSKEAKRPYVEEYESAMERWVAEKALIKSGLEAMEKVDNRGSHFNGFDLFRSVVPLQVTSDREDENVVSIAAKKWNELSPDERETYSERAKEMNEKGQEELLASTIQSLEKYKNVAGRPRNAHLRFRNEFMSTKLKENYEGLRREWAELCDEEKDQYLKPWKVDLERFKAESVKYKNGQEYIENKRNRTVNKAHIRQLEQELNIPKLSAGNVIHLFWTEKKVPVKGKSLSQISKTVSLMWKALSEEERMVYKEKWNKLRADWVREVAEIERNNADNPKMSELKAYRKMLKTAKQKLVSPQKKTLI